MPKYRIRYFRDSEQGDPLWFQQMNPTGPLFTADPEQAASFESEESARQSPACTFLLAPVNVVQIPLISQDQAFGDLMGTTCRGCDGKKQSEMSFCRNCYRALPPKMRRDLYRHIGDGYEAAFEAALAELKR